MEGGDIVKQYRKIARKRGIFKMKKGGPKFMPRGFGKREAPDTAALLRNIGILPKKNLCRKT